MIGTIITQFLIEEQRRIPEATGDLTSVINDIVANRLFLQCTELGGHVAAMASEEMESIHRLPGNDPKGRYLLLYDSVDGSYNINENTPIGTIFSILKRPDGATGQPQLAESLQTGVQQVCAGYAVYGPSCNGVGR